MNASNGPGRKTSDYWVIAALGVIVDQLTKSGITGWLHSGEGIVVTSFFNIVHVTNTGAAFSFMADQSGWQRSILSIVAVATCTVLVVLIRRKPPAAEAAAYSMMLAGGLGNLLDRLARGAVVDWLDFHWGRLHWPAFNAADVFITAGALLLVFSAFGGATKESRDRDTIRVW